MSTWTFRALLPAALLALGGCAEGVAVTRAAPETLAVAGASVVVAGPPGYCIDQAASGDRAAGAFVLLGSCASLTRDRGKPHPRDPGILSVTVSDGLVTTGETGPLLGELEAFFRTPEGRASLSRNGQAGSLELLETSIEDGALMIHARDAGGRARGLADDYWRALFAVNGRLVTVSVNAFSDTPLSEAAGAATLRVFANRIRAASRRGET